MAHLSILDHLYCQEEGLEFEEERPVLPVLLPEDGETERHLLSAAEAEEEEWAAALRSLAAKEGEVFPKVVLGAGSGDAGDSYLLSARKVAVEWIARATARHAFSALTALLAVNYLDRCFLPCAAGGGLLRLQEDKPWMGRLAAVACLSLAAKVEETRVPLLIDLQVLAPSEAATEEDARYVFEAKTVRRMELLVLSALGWRMNPVTPLSFIHHLLPRLCSKATSADPAAAIVARVRELVRRCEAALLSAMADWRWVQYPASVWAAAALLNAKNSAGEAAAGVDFQETHRLVALLNAPKEKVEECHNLMLESAGSAMIGLKRKHPPTAFYCSTSPASPSAVVGSCFSCENSCDSWAMWPPSSPEAAPPSKRLNDGTSKFYIDEGVEEEGVDFILL